MRTFAPWWCALVVPPALALPNGLGLTPPMGYSSWNDCASEITEARIKNVTRALIDSGLAAKGYIHVNVDEGWLKGRDNATGAMISDPVKFPSGMAALGAWIHDQEVPGRGKVMRYGLYTCRGTCQCSTALYHGPGSHGHVAQDAQWLADAGADYLKEVSERPTRLPPSPFPLPSAGGAQHSRRLASPRLTACRTRVAATRTTASRSATTGRCATRSTPRGAPCTSRCAAGTPGTRRRATAWATAGASRATGPTGARSASA